MTMYTVVAGIDTDESRALAQAKAISALPSADEEVRAILLHVFGENPEGGTVEQVKSVRRARDHLEEADVTVELEGSSGNPAETILRVAKREGADQIILAGRKRTPTGKVLFGSVTQSVILDSDRPVLVSPSE
ncbi:MAG: universal stress protein [Haloarculaceae archaeon]